MGSRKWFPSLRRGLESKQLSIGSRFGGGYGLGNRSVTYGLRDSTAGWDMDTVVADGYERVIWVYKAVEIISSNASRLPFLVTVDEDEIENHPLVRVMNKRANPIETGRQFRKRLSQQLLLSKKGAFVEVTTSRAGNVTRLDLLDPNRVRIVPDPGGDYIDYFEYTRYDGQVRPLDPLKVRWIREPHPLDIFSGTTPLEAAGISVELDLLARTYNANFIKRDGRPGGIIGVDTEGLPEKELTRIANLFDAGVTAAGKVTAIGVGKGGMNYVDTSAKPRDLAYAELAGLSRKEILAAFGVPESIAGDASDRTFDNASEEKYTFWHEIMLPHLDLIASAFDGDVPDQADCGFDTSEVEVLELPARRRRAEMMQEFDRGLRSAIEYRGERPELEIIDNPQTRALWMSPAKAPVPARPEDATALGMSDPGAAGGPQPGQLGPSEGGPAGEAMSASQLVQQAIAEGGHAPSSEDAPTVGSAAALVDSARQEQGDIAPVGSASAAVAQARMETKALTDGSGIIDPLAGRKFIIVPDKDEMDGFEAGEDELRRVELAVAAAIEALLAKQAQVVAAKLQSPKVRKGTPYWVAESETDTRGGDEPIDATRVVDAPRWAGELQETLLQVVPPASQQAANDLLAAMAASGALTTAVPLGAAVAGRAVEAPVATAEQVAQAAAQAAAAPAMLAITVAGALLDDWEAERVNDLNRLIAEQADAPDLTLLVEETKKAWAHEARQFADSVAVTVAQTAVTGGRDAAASAITPQPTTPAAGEGQLVELAPEVVRIWRTREDEKVRAAHRAANGQRRGLGEPFDVGGYPVRFPSDPLAPAAVSRFCRCWLRYEWTKGAKFTLPTPPSVAEAA